MVRSDVMMSIYTRTEPVGEGWRVLGPPNNGRPTLCEASPMNKEHVNAIDKWLDDGSREHDDLFVCDDNDLAEKILYIEPETIEPNMVVDITTKTRYCIKKMKVKCYHLEKMRKKSEENKIPRA
nr:hypothetical protein [Tanacetum cinerariifolium]